MEAFIVQSGEMTKVFSSEEKAKEFMLHRCAFDSMEQVESGRNRYGTYYSLIKRSIDE